MKLLKNNRGFTLVELIVVILLVSIVTTAVYGFFMSVNRYNKSIEVMNDYQNITADLMYRIRAELADAGEVEAIDTADATKFVPTDTNYMYIVSEPDGGITIYDVDASGNRTTQRFDTIDATNGYKTGVAFTTESNGRVTVTAEIERLDTTDALGNHTKPYNQSSAMVLRSAVAAGTQRAVRFKKV